MTDQPFQIPGLGQAKPNEQLPAQNFAPDLLAVAASFGGEAQLLAGGDGGAQPGEPQNQSTDEDKASPAGFTETAKADKSAEPKGLVGTAADADTMEVDVNENVTSAKEDETNNVDTSNTLIAPPSPGVTDALEAALAMHSDSGGPGPGGSVPSNEQGQTQAHEQVEDGEAEEGEHPEWEVDSSPYESSSESDSSDSSSEDSEDEGGYTLLGIEETARLLMEEDGYDESGRSGKNTAAPLRTKNEVAEDVLPKPDVTITPDMKIEPLGTVQFIVENTAVIKSQNPGEVQVLERTSVLCKEDRTIVGALTDILGNVRSPVYILRFATEEEAKETLEVGTQLFYSVDHAVYAFTQALKQTKGTDASNLHDEEVGADEMEFSDDEKEAEFKRQQKLKKRGGKTGRGGRDQPPHARNKNEPSQEPSGGGGILNYDDDDGPYKPLSRPSTFALGASVPSLPPKPEFTQPRGGFSHGNHDSRRGGRGDFRGRGRGFHRGGDRKFGSRRGSGDSGQDNRFPAAGQPLPHPPTTVAQNTQMAPPSFGAPPIPPPAQAPWPTAFPTPPPPPSTPNFNFAFQAWAQAQAQGQTQNQGQQYQYGQSAVPTTPVPPAWPGVATQTPQANPAWPGVAAQNPQANAYSTTNYYGGPQYGQQQQHSGAVAQHQQHQHQPQQPQQPHQHHLQHHPQNQQNQQQYWEQTGSYGHTQRGR